MGATPAAGGYCSVGGARDETADQRASLEPAMGEMEFDAVFGEDASSSVGMWCCCFSAKEVGWESSSAFSNLLGKAGGSGGKKTSLCGFAIMLALCLRWRRRM